MKICKPISGPELTVEIILLADWRCPHYVNKRQNGSCCCSYSRNDVPQVAQRNVSIAAHTWHQSVFLNDTVKVNPPYIVPSLSLSTSSTSANKFSKLFILISLPLKLSNMKTVWLQDDTQQWMPIISLPSII